MVTFEQLNQENDRITELANVLLYLFSDRVMCDSTICCDLFYRFMDEVKNHMQYVDVHLSGRLLTMNDASIHNTASNFMNGSAAINKILDKYRSKWCEKKAKGMKIGSQHERFQKDSDEMFRMLLDRIQKEQEHLYPLIRELSGDRIHAVV